MNFTPAFMLLTSPIITGEMPQSWGLAGVLLVTAGAFGLAYKRGDRSLLAPLKALARNPGAQMILGVAFLASISSNFDKLGVQASSGLLWGISISGFVGSVYLVLVVRQMRGVRQAVRRRWKPLAAASVLQVGVILCQTSALELIMAPYVISLKRASALFAVLFGWWVLREMGWGPRLIGAAVMVAGVLLIALS